MRTYLRLSMIVPMALALCGWTEPSKDDWQKLDRQFVTSAPLDQFVFSFASSKELSALQWKTKWKARKLDAAALTFLGQSEAKAPIYSLAKTDLPDGVMGYITGSIMNEKSAGQRIWVVDIYLVDKETGALIAYRNLAQAYREGKTLTEPMKSAFVDMNNDGKLDLIQKSEDGSQTAFRSYAWKENSFSQDVDAQVGANVVADTLAKFQKTRKPFP